MTINDLIQIMNIYQDAANGSAIASPDGGEFNNGDGASIHQIPHCPVGDAEIFGGLMKIEEPRRLFGGIIYNRHSIAHEFIPYDAQLRYVITGTARSAKPW